VEHQAQCNHGLADVAAALYCVRNSFGGFAILAAIRPRRFRSTVKQWARHKKEPQAK
jgi:hypothetical protein